MTDEEMVGYDWVLPRLWKWRNERWGRRRIVHIQTPRPGYDQRDRAAKWPALCGVDIRYGYKTDCPANHGSRERACKRCVARASQPKNGLEPVSTPMNAVSSGS